MKSELLRNEYDIFLYNYKIKDESSLDKLNLLTRFIDELEINMEFKLYNETIYRITDGNNIYTVLLDIHNKIDGLYPEMDRLINTIKNNKALKFKS